MYEQGAVSWAVGGAVCEALAAYAAGATTYLPQPEHVAFALDLMEIALNVHGLIETCIQVRCPAPAKLVAGSISAENDVLSFFVYV